MRNFAVLLLLGCAGLSAQELPDRAKASGLVGINVIRPLTLTHGDTPTMNFGGFYSPEVDSEIRLWGDGRREVMSGSITLRASEPGQADLWHIKADPRYPVSYLPGEDVEFTLTGPKGATMTGRVNGAMENGKLMFGYPILMDKDGKCDMYVGGFLRVAANQAPGVYTGSYHYTVLYE